MKSFTITEQQIQVIESAIGSMTVPIGPNFQHISIVAQTLDRIKQQPITEVEADNVVSIKETANG